jgi:hypothetical protein
MAGSRSIAPVSLTAGSRTPVYTGAVTAAASFSIKNGIATIVLGSALPANGYNPPSYSSPNGGGPAAGGQKVTLWAFTTATYFNGETVDVIANNPALNSFSFNTTHADVGSTNDAGNTAVAPAQQYRSVRLEVDQSAGAGKIFVGDLSVSSTQYAECLTLTGQIAVTIASGAIPVDRIFCDTSANGTKVQVSLMY